MGGPTGWVQRKGIVRGVHQESPKGRYGGGGPLKVSPQAYKGFKVKKKNSVFGPLSKIPGSSLVAH